MPGWKSPIRRDYKVLDKSLILFDKIKAPVLTERANFTQYYTLNL